MSNSTSGSANDDDSACVADHDDESWRELAPSVTAAAATAGNDASTMDDVAAPADSLTLALQSLQTNEATASLQPSGSGAINAKAAAALDRLLTSEHAAEEDELGLPPVPAKRRASSLKVPAAARQAASSHPEDHPDHKKAVRFADAMGLDLASVRHVLDLESPPEIPPQATRDLVLPPSDDECDDEDGDKAANKDCLGNKESAQLGQQQQQRLYLSPAFAQPGSAPNFYSRIAAQRVVLEGAHYVAPAAASAAAPVPAAAGQIHGLVRVANLGFEKSVRVRVTFDDWRSSIEVGADYQPGIGAGGGSDQFAFVVGLPAGTRVGDRVVFCVAYSVNGETYWDSNFGDNYSFHWVALNSQQTVREQPSQAAWTRYF